MTLVFEDGVAITISQHPGRLWAGMDRTNSTIRQLNCDSSGNLKVVVV